MYGFKEGDGYLNDCGVCTSKCPTEIVDLMEGWKGKDVAKVKIATTPDGTLLIGIDVMYGTGGWGYAPSVSGTPYRTRLQAIEAAAKKILASTYIESDKCKAIIEDNLYRIKNESEQLWLF